MSAAPTLPLSVPLNRAEAAVATLANGLRVLALPMPWRQTVSLSVFIRTGSLHEPRRLNGISHVVEHMAFKGTATRDCQRINLDAERLGAEVNAHTDKDHTAFHIEGLPGDLDSFVGMLADIVLNSTFPADELERERQVILHELTDTEEDPVTIAFQLFDRASFGAHPAGRPVIGARAGIERLQRDDLLRYVQQQYSACNVVVAAAGAVQIDALAQAAERAFGAMPEGTPNTVLAAPWQGGLLTRRMAGCSQCQTVMGYPSPPLHDPAHIAHVLAAAVLGEGMSSPLLDEIRERRGLAYHVACSADVTPWAGQFVVEAATAPEQTQALLGAIDTLLQRHAERIDPVDLERARRQLRVRAWRALEHPARRLETGVQDLYTFGRVRSTDEWLAQLDGVTATAVREVFAGMRGAQAAIALAGSVKAGARSRALELLPVKT